ncbi:MAG: phosphoribosyltransferase family protein [Planctomycetota bacterium]|nr:phosphoribosyltransferase family protein [Planctomycetota bacterium]
MDDIFDTGHTLDKIVERIRVRQPKSIRSAVLLTKLGRSEVQIKPDYSVFEIPDEFVVGYGLDYQDEYRHLPHIAVLEAADLA